MKFPFDIFKAIEIKLCYRYTSYIRTKSNNGKILNYPFISTMWPEIHEALPIKMSWDFTLLPGDLEAMGIKE